MKKLLNTPVICCFFSILYAVIYFIKLDISALFFEMTILQIFLVVLSIEDIKEKMISDKYILCVLVNSIIFRIILFDLMNFINGVITGMVIALMIVLVKKVFKQKIGMGDLKLLAALSITYGYAGMINVLFFSIIIAMLYGIVMMILKKKNKNSEIPFVPFVSLGCFLTVISI